MPLIRKPICFACRAERLARTRAGPRASGVWPSATAEDVTPHADACKEMTLVIALNLDWFHVADVALINIAIRDETRGDQVTKPLRCVLVDLVVIGRQFVGGISSNATVRPNPP